MKTRPKSFVAVVTMLAALGVATPSAHSQPVPGVPEPGLILYGQVRNASAGNSLLSYGTLRWTVTPSAGGAAVTIPVTLTNINDQFSYVARVPFETLLPTQSGSPSSTPSANTLPLGGSSNYTRSATVSATFGGSQQPATILAPALGTFNFGAIDRGRIEHVDLQVSLAFVDTDGDSLDDNWERAYFGSLAQLSNADPDGDGMQNSDEQKAGTNPNDPQSRFAFIDVQRTSPTAVTVRWSSVALSRYSVLRSTDVQGTYLPIQSNITATPGTNTFIDPNATSPTTFFYRIRVD